MPDGPFAEAHHTLALRRRLGALSLDVDLRLHAPWTVLYGPSGSGKSSLLRAACGLLGRSGVRLTRGTGQHRVLQDEARYTPPHARQIGWAPQAPSLFPHLTVRENLLFAGQRHINDLVDLFDLSPLLTRHPSDLSGGEQQRVNLARSLTAPECRLLLLDEPFTGMDRNLRNTLLPKLAQYLVTRSLPVLSVTHDLEEVFQLQAWVVRLREGAIEQQGSASHTLSLERTQVLSALGS